MEISQIATKISLGGIDNACRWDLQMQVGMITQAGNEVEGVGGQILLGRDGELV